MVIYAAKKRLTKESGRFGFCVSKKHGNAVKRNLIRRRLREIVSRHRKLSEEQWDIIILVKKKIHRASFAQMEEDYQRIIHKLREQLL